MAFSSAVQVLQNGTKSATARTLHGKYSTRPYQWNLKPCFVTPGQHNCSPPLLANDQRHNAVGSRQFRVSEQILVIISIGSTQRAQLQEAQSATFGQHIKTYFFDEDKLPECTLCETTFYHSAKGSKAPYYFTSTVEHVSDPAFSKDEGWWCAQKRPLKALRRVLQESGTLPKWALVVDDDTFVDAKLLGEYVRDAYAEKPLVLGCTSDYRGGWIDGGAGWLINDIVMKGLLTVTERSSQWDGSSYVQSGQSTILDGCIRRQEGGDWCFFHSDWAAAACVNSIGHGDIINQTGYKDRDLFLQRYNPAAIQGEGSFITAHYSNREMQMNLYDKRKAHWRPAPSESME